MVGKFSQGVRMPWFSGTRSWMANSMNWMTWVEEEGLIIINNSAKEAVGDNIYMQHFHN